MTGTWSGLRRLRPYGLWLLAVVGGALASVLVLLLFYRLGGLPVVAPPVVLEATHESALRIVDLGTLKAHAYGAAHGPRA